MPKKKPSQFQINSLISIPWVKVTVILLSILLTVIDILWQEEYLFNGLYTLKNMAPHFNKYLDIQTGTAIGVFILFTLLWFLRRKRLDLGKTKKEELMTSFGTDEEFFESNLEDTVLEPIWQEKDLDDIPELNSDNNLLVEEVIEEKAELASDLKVDARLDPIEDEPLKMWGKYEVPGTNHRIAKRIKKEKTESSNELGYNRIEKTGLSGLMKLIEAVENKPDALTHEKESLHSSDFFQNSTKKNVSTKSVVESDAEQIEKEKKVKIDLVKTDFNNKIKKIKANIAEQIEKSVSNILSESLNK